MTDHAPLSPSTMPATNQPRPYVNRADSRDRVSALQFTGNFDEVERFVGGDAEFRAGKLIVATTHGPLTAASGDWIVRDWRGRFTTYPPHLFTDMYRDAEALYEAD